MEAHHEINRRKTVVKRIIMLALGVLLALVVAAPTVLAQGNGGAPEDASGTIPPEDVAQFFPGHCSFPIQLELSGKGNVITLPDGRRILTSPGLHVTVTNMDNGEQATFNITGTFHETTNPENGEVTTKVTGRNLLFDPEAGVVLTIGEFTYVFDAEGNLIQAFEGKGQVIDVCALLG
jgi:hypothetical protein